MQCVVHYSRSIKNSWSINNNTRKTEEKKKNSAKVLLLAESNPSSPFLITISSHFYCFKCISYCQREKNIKLSSSTLLFDYLLHFQLLPPLLRLHPLFQCSSPSVSNCITFFFVPVYVILWLPDASANSSALLKHTSSPFVHGPGQVGFPGLP